jgi:hypothetical protein
MTAAHKREDFQMHLSYPSAAPKQGLLSVVLVTTSAVEMPAHGWLFASVLRATVSLLHVPERTLCN